MRHHTRSSMQNRPGLRNDNVQIPILLLISQKRRVRLREVAVRSHNQQAAQLGCERGLHRPSCSQQPPSELLRRRLCGSRGSKRHPCAQGTPNPVTEAHGLAVSNPSVGHGSSSEVTEAPESAHVAGKTIPEWTLKDSKALLTSPRCLFHQTKDTQLSTGTADVPLKREVYSKYGQTHQSPMFGEREETKWSRWDRVRSLHSEAHSGLIGSCPLPGAVWQERSSALGPLFNFKVY